MRNTPRPLRIGFVGAGNMAGHHLQALRHVTTSHIVVGVHDASPANARAFSQRAGTRAYATLFDLLEEARPDLVHICTPAGTHFEPARLALRAGAHVYVEKPFVETPEEAEQLFEAAREHGRLICAGHQLLREPAYRKLMEGAAALGPVTFVSSDFAFRPPRLNPWRATPRELAAQLLDIVPHPLYTLVSALEGAGGAAERLELVNVTASATSLHALLRAGEVTGRLYVSLRARPVASTLTISGANGSLTADFVRSIVLGAANEGTSPVEKILNPFVEATQLSWRSASSLAKRLAHGADYPGLGELFADFYAAAATNGSSPTSLDHLRRVTGVYQLLAASVRNLVARPSTAPAATMEVEPYAPIAVVTGAAGFFGRSICRELSRRGFRVRGVGRSGRRDDPHVHEWIRADLAEGVGAEVLAGASVVVHAAAETNGGFEAHERNSVEATRQLIRAMDTAGVRRLVYVSSISVLRPPHSPWERQTEETPLATQAERLGPYTWGKCCAEQLVADAVRRMEIEARIIRPAALVDWQAFEFPGLLGRRLFGGWHLGLGRPGLPFAICEVGRASSVVAWSADCFAEAPKIVNLFEPTISTRAQLLQRIRERGWTGRMLWMPISLLAVAMTVGRNAAALVRGARARPLAVWSILRPRRYDPSLSERVLEASAEIVRPPLSPPMAQAAVHVSRAYG